MRHEAGDQEFWIPDFLFLTYDILHTTYLFKNCNKFTIVRSAECRVMSEMWKRRIAMGIARILKAFLSFVPKLTRCRMGTGLKRDKGRAVPADFFPNFRNFFFFSSLPTACCLLSTASPIIGHLCSSLMRFRPSLKSFRYCPTTFRYSPKRFSLSLESFCPCLASLCPDFAKEYQVSELAPLSSGVVGVRGKIENQKSVTRNRQP